MTPRSLALWLCLFCAYTPRLGARSEGPMEVPPWYGDNAVLAQEDAPFGARPRPTGISGTTTHPGALVCSFSVEAGAWLDLERPSRSSRARDPGLWQATLRDGSTAAQKALFSGYPFDMRFAERVRKSGPREIGHLTNLVVGPVWAVVVDPELDAHELPGLTPNAKIRIRVLAFGANLGPESCTGWMGAEEAEDRKLSAFSGLARAFANSLATADRVAIGIVLIPRDAAPLKLPPGRSPGGWRPLDRDEKHAVLLEAVGAVRAANEGAREGANARAAIASRKHQDLLTDLKREGVVGPPFAIKTIRWEQICPGDSPSIPFRVTGVIW